MVILDEYGTYNNAVVASVADYLNDTVIEPRSPFVGNSRINYYENIEIWAFRDGKLYTLAEALEAGVLTQEHVTAIAEINERWFPVLELDSTDKAKMPLLLYYLRSRTRPAGEDISETIEAFLGPSGSFMNHNTNARFWYIGLFNGYSIGVYDPCIGAGTDVEIVGNETFYIALCYPTVSKTSAIKNHREYRLQELFDTEELTESELKQIDRIHSRYYPDF